MHCFFMVLREFYIEGESTIIKESTSNPENGYYVNEMQKGFGMKLSRTPLVFKLQPTVLSCGFIFLIIYVNLMNLCIIHSTLQS